MPFEVASANPRIMELPVATATAILRGQLVQFTPGVGIIAHAAPTDTDDPIFGVAMEAHDGATAGRQVGLKIKVAVPEIDRPLVLRNKCVNIITATGGSVTTFVCSGLVPASDDYWNGGYIQVVTCAADSTMIGKRIKITDHTGSGGTLTFATQPAAFASGDTAKVCPGLLALTVHTWDCDSTGITIDWDAAATGEALELVDADPANMVAYFKLRQSQTASYPLAI